MSAALLNPNLLGAASMGDEEREALLRVFDRGELFRHFDGQSECDALESELGEHLGTGALALSSGTAALRAALTALGITHGDRVLVSAWTFVASASAVLSLGARPVAVDVRPDLGVDAEDFARKATGARAAVLTYLPGHTSNIHLLPPVVPLIEDACQALGVRAGPSWAGCSTRIGVTSFQQGKQLSAGEGGALFTREENLLGKARRFTDHGSVREGLPDWEHPLADIGENLRMTELQAALLRPQLRRLPDLLAAQRHLRSQLREVLTRRGLGVLDSRAPDEDSGSNLLLLARSSQEAEHWSREARVAGVLLRPIWPTCWMDLGSMRRRGLQPPPEDCPRARAWAPRVRAMPVPPDRRGSCAAAPGSRGLCAMALKVRATDPRDFHHPCPSLELWQDPALAPLLGPCRFWVARRGEAVVGTWLTPTRADGREASREHRVLPYAAPWLVPDSAPRRRRVWRALLEAVLAEARLVELPMEPGFVELGPLSAVGCLVETRHTHVLDLLDDPEASLSPTARAHTRRARRTVDVSPQPVPEFDFKRAIHGSSAAALDRRRELAQHLSTRQQAWALVARCEGRPVGGTLGILSGDSLIAMHAWFDRVGPSGVPTLLVVELARLAKTLGANRLDLEGSVIARVDRFMDTIATRVEPVPHVHWGRSRAQLLASLEESLDIPGRQDLDRTGPAA